MALEALFRIEPAYKPADWLTLSGSLDARIDTIEQVEREWRVDVRDRGLQRPALSLRHARATHPKGNAHRWTSASNSFAGARRTS